MSYNSKYTGEQVEGYLDKIANGEIGGGIEAETDPVFSASPAATITDAKITEWNDHTEMLNSIDLDLSALTYAIGDKVDKVTGKGLSTEDFTSALKSKLEGLSNYDDTKLSNALSTLRTDFDKLVSGDTTTAIKTFNEIVAFLDGIEDSQDLEGIIASIEQQIAGKMDRVTLATVATSGSYEDLKNKPTIPAEQVNADWNATSGKAQILNKPTIPSAVTESTVSNWGFTKNSGTITEVKANGASIAKSGVANIPAASTSAYGVTKLSSSTSSTSTTLAATASAVKAAYDLANSYKGTVTSVKINGTTKSPSSGVVDIGNVVTSVKLNGATYSPSSGVVDLGNISGGGSSSDSDAGEQYIYEGNSQQVTLLNNTLHFIDIATNKTLAISTNALEKGQTSRVVIWIHRNVIPTISISEDVYWANDDVPVMNEPGYCYELSFTKAWDQSIVYYSNPRVLGVWAKYYAGMTSGGAGGGAD